MGAGRGPVRRGGGRRGSSGSNAEPTSLAAEHASHVGLAGSSCIADQHGLAVLDPLARGEAEDEGRFSSESAAWGTQRPWRRRLRWRRPPSALRTAAGSPSGHLADLVLVRGDLEEDVSRSPRHRSELEGWVSPGLYGHLLSRAAGREWPAPAETWSRTSRTSSRRDSASGT